MGAAASAPTQPTALTCPSKAKGSGIRCQLRAGFGTDHVGYGLCKFHGGKSRSGNVQAARLEAAVLGGELEMDPHDALLLTVRRAAMWERYCAEKVAKLDPDRLVAVKESELEGQPQGGALLRERAGELNVWLRQHQAAIRDLAHIAKVAVDAGVEERRVRLAEQLVGDIADALDLVLTRLGVRDHPDAPAAVRAALQLVEAPKAIAERSAA